MELFFIGVIGLVLGTFVRYILPLRENYGVTVTIATAGAVATLSSALLEVAGLTWDNPWIWVISLVLAVVIPGAIALLLGRRRESEYRHTLSTVAG
ncbi:MAG: hypothetical protein ACTJHU_03100 [Mycetocola sp.]